MKHLTRLAAPALAAALALPAGAATFGMNEIALSLGDKGQELRVLAGTGAGTSVALKDASGKTVRIDDIDFRPSTGGLYGYSNQTNTVYLIDRMTGLSTAVATATNITGSGDLGFDFNNKIDAARVVTDGPGKRNDNVVFFPENFTPGSAATLTAFTGLAYAAGDVNAGKDPAVEMNAYTNALPKADLDAAGVGVTQFVIDHSRNTLATLANNTGILTTIGTLFHEGAALDISGDGGFDILSLMPNMNTAYALLTSGKGTAFNQSIYSFGLTADASGRINLSLVSDVTQGPGLSDRLDGFAVFTAPAAVPLPASVLLLGAAIGGLGLAARRRNRKDA